MVKDATGQPDLLGAIHEELRAQNAGLDLGLSDKVMDRLAAMIAHQIEHKYEVRYTPRSAEEGSRNPNRSLRQGSRRFLKGWDAYMLSVGRFNLLVLGLFVVGAIIWGLITLVGSF